MALLKIISGEMSGASYTIGSECLKIGRAEGNDLQLRDGSVSSRHCEVSLDPDGNLLVRDLGSTNGTYIEGLQVREPALALPGQRVRFGNLELLFEGEGKSVSAPEEEVTLNLPPKPMAAPPPVRTNVVAVTPAVAGPDDCPNHPGVKATLVCGRCGKQACKQCTKQQKLGMNLVDFCLSCGGQCKKMSQAKKEAAIAAERPKSYKAAVSGSLGYPFRGNGLTTLICGSIFCTVIDFLAGFTLIYLIPLMVILYGYLFAYMQKIVVTSAAGDSDPPDWPEVSDIHQDIVQPFLQLLFTLAVSFIPALVVWVMIGALAGQFMLLLGMIYFPMALLGVAMSDSYGALNPIFVLSSVMRAPGDYVMTCLSFGAVVFLRVFVHGAIDEIGIPFLPFLVYWIIFLVALMIQMRILGMFYFLNRNRLGWGL